MISLEKDTSISAQFFALFNDKKTWSCNPRTPDTDVGGGSDIQDDDHDDDYIDMQSDDGKYYASCKAAGFAFPARGCAGNPQGGRWQRFLKKKENAADREEYESLKGNLSAQAEFRAKWCKAQYTNHVKERKHVLQKTTTEYSDGRYLTVDRCIVEDANKVTAMNYCLRCLTMGFPWVKYCSWRKTTMFMYKLEGIHEAQMEQWTMTKTAWEQKTKDHGVTYAP